MKSCKQPLILVLGLAVLTACTRTPPAPPAATEPAAIQAVSIAWKKAYNAGDAAAVAALYAEDAVLSAPGAPALRDHASISEYFVKVVAQFSTTGLTVVDEPMGEVVTSGDLAWQWQTYKVVDKSGAIVDAGKLVTLFRRVDGKWLIAGDTWNSDGTAAAAATPAPAPGAT